MMRRYRFCARQLWMVFSRFGGVHTTLGISIIGKRKNEIPKRPCGTTERHGYRVYARRTRLYCSREIRICYGCAQHRARVAAANPPVCTCACVTRVCYTRTTRPADRRDDTLIPACLDRVPCCRPASRRPQVHGGGGASVTHKRQIRSVAK